MKRNFKKELASVVFSLILTGCSTFNIRNTFYKQEIPKEFYNYKKKARNIKEGYILFPILFFYRFYDINGDGNSDVGELYLPESANPLLYGFDINGNHTFEDNEIIIDEAQDGLNNNEIRFDKYKNEKKLRILI